MDLFDGVPLSDAIALKRAISKLDSQLREVRGEMEILTEEFKSRHRPPFVLYPSIRKNKGARTSLQITWRKSQPQASYIRLYNSDGVIRDDLVGEISSALLGELVDLDFKMIGLNQNYAFTERVLDQFKETQRRLLAHGEFVIKTSEALTT